MSTVAGDASDWLAIWRRLVEDVEPGRGQATLRGSAIAREGLFEGPIVAAGNITGVLAERDGAVAKVAVRWPEAPGSAWHKAAAMIADRVGLTASLLDGDIAGDLVTALANAGVALAPASLAELNVVCDHGDGPWCRHEFAVLHAFLARARVDPTLVLRFRGRDLDRLVHDVRKARGGPVGLRPPVEGRGELNEIVVRPRLADDPSWLLHELGMPPGLEDREDLLNIMTDAAAMAWRLASGDGADAADEQLVLAELRARHAASASAVAEALGIGREATQRVLDDLYQRGLVLRTGSAERARYRASVASRGR